MTNKITDFPDEPTVDPDGVLYLVQDGNDRQVRVDTLHEFPVNGFVDYNNASATVALTPDVWVQLPNDTVGAFTNENYPPIGFVSLMDPATGKIDPTDLDLGDFLVIRNDFEITPSSNNAAVEFQYTLGSGAGSYTLTQQLGRLDRGSGIPYRFSLRTDMIYMGDTNTRDNPIGLEVRCTAAATVSNAGIAIGVVKR